MASKILIAEDEDSDVLLLKRALAKAHVEAPVEIARNGEEAIQLLGDSGTEPVLLLLDLNMPRVNGFEVLNWLRDQPSARKVSVVVLSSSGEIEDIRRAGSLGVRAYIVKPHDPSELVRIMERVQQFCDEPEQQKEEFVAVA